MPKGLKLSIGNQTIMFTDVIGSTVFYNKSGDIKAFELIQKHFVICYSLIEQYHGLESILYCYKLF